MRNAGLEEAQAGIKIARRIINNLRYADDTTLMAENEEELQCLLMKVKEESKNVGLRLNIRKMKIMASGPTTSWFLPVLFTVKVLFSFLLNFAVNILREILETALFYFISHIDTLVLASMARDIYYSQ